MKRILAISGGVDSMVLLDRVYREFGGADIIVAHFDHGTRPSSVDDAEFVRRAAAQYDLPFVLGRAELGPNASEEEARYSRYEFFSSVASEYGGKIYTAHHTNDLIESMTINLVRGTGWRGLAPFGNLAIRRPLISENLAMSKRDILCYAAKHEIVFRQDPTNTDERYLRNRLRHEVNNLPSDMQAKLLEIYHRMNNLRGEVDEILAEILPEDGRYERDWFSDLDDLVALEILRAALLRAGVSATRPQILDFLSAIRTYGSGKKFNLPGDRLVRFTKSGFVL